MRAGIYVSSMGRFGDPAVLRDLAVAAEVAGWSGFFMWDVLTAEEPDPPVADPWVTLAAVAQATTTLLLGPMVVPVPRRHPGKLALEVATLQSLAGGRLVLGVGTGAGWDHERFGDHAGRRELGQRLDDGVALLHALLSGEPVDHDGPHLSAHDVRYAHADVPVWTSGFWPRSAPVRGATGAAGLFPQIPGAAADFRRPTPDEVRTMKADFVRSGGRADGDVALWSPSQPDPPDATLAAAYEDAGATWWFQDGSELAVDELHERIAAGPPPWLGTTVLP